MVLISLPMINCLKAVLDRLQSKGVTLNTAKCSFNQRKLKFLGHVIDSRGISADPDKIAALRDILSPYQRIRVETISWNVNTTGKIHSSSRRPYSTSA